MDEELTKARLEANVALKEWREFLPSKRYRSWLRKVTHGRKSVVEDLSLEECREVVALVAGSKENELDWEEIAAARSQLIRGRPTKRTLALSERAFHANPVRYLELTQAVRFGLRVPALVKEMACRKRQEGRIPRIKVRKTFLELFGPPGQWKSKGARLLKETGLLDQLRELRGRPPEDKSFGESVLEEALRLMREKRDADPA